MPASIFRAKNPDPYASGKYRDSARNFTVAGWLFLVFTVSIFIDEFLVEKLENETVISLSERSEYVPGRRSKGETFLHVDLKTRTYAITVDPYVLLKLELKQGDRVDFWRTRLYHQKIRMTANGKEFPYKTVLEEMKVLVIIQGLAALIGLLRLVPWSSRFTLIFISGVLCLYSFLVILVN